MQNEFNGLRFLPLRGEILTEYTTRLFDAVYTPFILGASKLLGGRGLIHSILIGELNGSQIDLVKGVFRLPEETVAALIIGLVRKDAAVVLSGASSDQIRLLKLVKWRVLC